MQEYSSILNVNPSQIKGAKNTQNPMIAINNVPLETCSICRKTRFPVPKMELSRNQPNLEKILNTYADVNELYVIISKCECESQNKVHKLCLLLNVIFNYELACDKCGVNYNIAINRFKNNENNFFCGYIFYFIMYIIHAALLALSVFINVIKESKTYLKYKEVKYCISTFLFLINMCILYFSILSHYLMYKRNEFIYKISIEDIAYRKKTSLNYKIFYAFYRWFYNKGIRHQCEAQKTNLFWKKHYENLQEYFKYVNDNNNNLPVKCEVNNNTSNLSNLVKQSWLENRSKTCNIKKGAFENEEKSNGQIKNDLENGFKTNSQKNMFRVKGKLMIEDCTKTNNKKNDYKIKISENNDSNNDEKKLERNTPHSKFKKDDGFFNSLEPSSSNFGKSINSKNNNKLISENDNILTINKKKEKSSDGSAKFNIKGSNEIYQDDINSNIKKIPTNNIFFNNENNDSSKSSNKSIEHSPKNEIKNDKFKTYLISGNELAFSEEEDEKNHSKDHKFTKRKGTKKNYPTIVAKNLAINVVVSPTHNRGK